ncbi:dehydrogenase/reductase SDR family member 13 [Diaporthe helianthi]|uniref:Dehydrogenase/reductase SDR family member 13 n=1 Tax=Diaporthe helianthi TaxID=158607 RepID=A0A2P5HGB6_DIAHE|nr:dehydrogenase/reductase SDR family member 13 [Diaporthe helianthi]
MDDDIAAKTGGSNPFVWLSTLIMALDLNFLITFLYNQFRRLPKPEKRFTGKTIIVTGANVGLGLEAARHFARLDAARVILACRDTDKGERARADIERSTGRSDVVEVWALDLCSFESVKEFCHRADQLPRLDVVVENASVAFVGPLGKLAEGFESTITVNVLATFLMALLLLPTLRRTAAKFNVQPNLVIVSSDAHFVADERSLQTAAQGKIFDAFKSTSVAPDRYQTSKLLQIFLTRQLAQEMSKPANNSNAKVILNTLNPGFCRTALFRDNKFPASIFLIFTSQLLGRSAEVGSRVIVDAAAAGPETHGKWLDTLHIREPSAYVRSEEGHKIERRLYDELMEILDRVEPNIASNI